ncbi:MAG: HEPN domain-containing protein [Eubacteriales bacterium]|nr:HEPN domain-containing protein [Eubacteriales bacterium]MDD4582784.1 HEPN domain-containing protein [Eubacteriales bacterium]
MTPAEKYVYWRILSDYDIETAQCLIQGKRWTYVAFVCHQAVERLLKGMHVYHTKKETPKTHNLNYIFNRIIKEEAFLKEIKNKEAFHVEKLDFIEFMVDLMFYYMSDYPFSYKKVMDRFIDEERAIEVYRETLKLLAWLKTFQKEPDPSNIMKG